MQISSFQSMNRPFKLHPAVFLTAFCFALGIGATLSLHAAPASYFKPGVPDLDQRKATRVDGGNNHCSPTASANSLRWFDNNGYDVVPDEKDDDGLIDEVATRAKTNGADGKGTAYKGTWNDDMVKGLREYLRDPAFNKSPYFWDVKFQGTEYFRGYTVGQNNANVQLDWLKQELADGEDVLMSVKWYKETSPGTYTPLGGAHQITLDGYTSGGENSSLLIRDPWYAEGIIERDEESGGRLMYKYSTGTENLRAEVVSAISVSPKEWLFFDGLPDPTEYMWFPFPVTTPNGSFAYGANYPDYLSLGFDLPTITQDLVPETAYGQIDVFSEVAGAGVRITFDNDTNNTEIEIFNPDSGLWEPFDNTTLGVQLAYAFDISPEGTDPHVQTEVFIDKETFGEFGIDSFFDITYQIVDIPGGGDLFNESFGQVSLAAQFLSNGDPDAPTIPWDFTAVGLPYPDDNPLAITDDDPRILAEIAARNAAIASIIPEPGSLALLVVGFGLTLKRRG